MLVERVEQNPIHVETRYVAFCDILGFSSRILSDFDKTLEVYSEFGRSIYNLPPLGVQVTMYSDAILVVSETLDKALVAIQALCFVALSRRFMVRGALTRGKYWEQRIGNHFLVASDALVQAVQLEKTIGIPAVVVADDVEIPDGYWLSRFEQGRFVTPLLHFDARNIVNPFGKYWFKSAQIRANELMAESPAHADKYRWFLSLYDAVEQNYPLIPQDVLQRFIDAGILRPNGERSQDRLEPG
jgi:hypothetical protein